MEAEFWHDRWEQNRIGFHDDAVNAHLQQFWDRLHVPPNATVFVPLCGKSRDMWWLHSLGYQVLGVELSPIAAESFFTENHLSPTTSRQGAFLRWEAAGLTILQGDYFSLRPEDVSHCEAVFDRASLIALPPDMRMPYVEQFHRLFATGLDLLLLTLEYDQSIASGPPFAVFDSELSDHYGQNYRIDLLKTADVSDELPSLRKRGVTAIKEKVYQLTSRS